jgi:3-oxoacyl-[acyl-carrier-protein] synthase-3
MTSATFGILGTGSAVPERVLTNADLAQMVDTSDEWITQRTGIKERRILAEGQTTSDLCIEASRKALESAGLTAKDIDLIVVGTVTPDQHVPATACKIHQALGCGEIPAFDLAAGCSGFIYSSAVAKQFLAAGTCQRVLVVGAESLSRITNYEDRRSCILFGDGAGAVIYGTGHSYGELVSSSLSADGSGYEVMYIRAGAAEQPLTHELLDEKADKLVINGQAVYRFAVKRMVHLVRGQMEANPGLELGGVIPHQVNMRILESAREKLDLPEARIYLNIERYGNMSAASIPVALDEARRSGFLDGMEGKLVVMCAFGAGLTWGALGFRW